MDKQKETILWVRVVVAGEGERARVCDVRVVTAAATVARLEKAAMPAVRE